MVSDTLNRKLVLGTLISAFSALGTLALFLIEMVYGKEFRDWWGDLSTSDFVAFGLGFALLISLLICCSIAIRNARLRGELRSQVRSGVIGEEKEIALSEEVAQLKARDEQVQKFRRVTHYELERTLNDGREDLLNLIHAPLNSPNMEKLNQRSSDRISSALSMVNRAIELLLDESYQGSVSVYVKYAEDRQLRLVAEDAHPRQSGELRDHSHSFDSSPSINRMLSSGSAFNFWSVSAGDKKSPVQLDAVAGISGLVFSGPVPDLPTIEGMLCTNFTEEPVGLSDHFDLLEFWLPAIADRLVFHMKFKEAILNQANLSMGIFQPNNSFLLRQLVSIISDHRGASIPHEEAERLIHIAREALVK